MRMRSMAPGAARWPEEICAPTIRFLVPLLAATLIAPPAFAQENAEALAKKLSNPVAALISVPLQLNYDQDIGPADDGERFALNIQPVIPFKLNEEWNLITRWILPVIYQPPLFEGDRADFGLGNFNPSFFLTTNLSSNVMFGAGPTFFLPTATDRSLGSNVWGAGPTAAIVWTPGKWVVGALVNNIWSFEGDARDPRVNQFLLQYFINYNLAHGWYLSSSPIVTADWTLELGHQWTLPFGGGVGRVFKIGAQPVNMSLSAYDNVLTIEDGPDWQLRFQVQLLFPTGG